MSVKEKLERPNQLRRALNKLTPRLNQLRSASVSTTGKMDAPSGSRGKGREGLWAALADLEQEEQALRAQLAAAEQEVDRLLVLLRHHCGLRLYLVLRWRCRLGKSWGELRQEISAVYGTAVCDKTARNWYDEAIRAAQAWEKEQT